jgi:uncharacterized protein (TIGR03083 family)
MAFPHLDLTPGPDLPDLDLPSAFRAARHRIMALARGLTPEELDTPVVACPEWTVRDIVAHQAGVSADVVAGNVADAPSDAWTSAQVEARRDRALEELLVEWEADALQVEPLMPQFPAPFTFMVVDINSHENDLLGTLGRPVRRDDPVFTALAARHVRTVGPKLTEKGLPPLAIRAGEREWVAGKGDPEGSVTAPDTFELVRAGTGRRSTEQIKAWEWSVEPEPYVESLSLFAPRPTPLVE